MSVSTPNFYTIRKQTIIAERNRKNLSQFKLAEMINVSNSTIGLIERGIQTPSIFLVLDIAKVLNIDINVLLEGIE